MTTLRNVSELGRSSPNPDCLVQQNVPASALSGSDMKELDLLFVCETVFNSRKTEDILVSSWSIVLRERKPLPPFPSSPKLEKA